MGLASVPISNSVDQIAVLVDERKDLFGAGSINDYFKKPK
jgi:hypothetical protein